jgi:hypothetical protein
LYSPKSADSPAAISVLSDRDRTLKDETISQVKDALLNMDHEEMKELADQIVEIPCKPDERPKSPSPSALERENIERIEKRNQQSCGGCVII